MTCSVTIQSVSATAQGTGSVLHITVVASDCPALGLFAQCTSGDAAQMYPLTGAASETVTVDLATRCPCGADVHINAFCVDPSTGQQLAGCTGDFYGGTIDCGNPCCIPPQITYVAGRCNANNEQLVTFTTVWNIPTGTPSSCFPMVGQLNFGNAGGVGVIQYIAGPGAHSFTDSYSYPAATSTTYTAEFVYSNPSCPPVPITVTVGPCAPPDCCPQITNVTIDIGPCRSDCTRAVTIKTHFSPPSPGCLAETLQWHFDDKNGNLITNVSSNAFLTSGASPNFQSFIFDPAQAPITAQLTGLQYPNCAAVVRTINIPPCDVAPACPTINSFSANVMGCENVGGECLRRVDFTVAADIAAGCGASAGTTMEIDFGDGDQAQLSYSTSGPESTTISHHYAAGGNYVATLTIVNPSPCQRQLINVQVPACTPQDCNLPSPCPPLPTPPPGCYCKFCYIFSQKAGKGWCKAILTLVALYVGLVIVLAFLGVYNFSPKYTFWQNLGAAISFFGSVFIIVWYDKQCSDCCVACALLLAMILAIITVIILLIIGVTINWPSGIVALFAIFVTWLVLYTSCNAYAAQNLTANNWCQ
jgi:hypothetical protein